MSDRLETLTFLECAVLLAVLDDDVERFQAQLSKMNRREMRELRTACRTIIDAIDYKLYPLNRPEQEEKSGT